jgi:hypothetical protein
MPFAFREERLRNEERRRPIVVISVRDIVRVELGLVVEVEDRSVVELAVTIIGNMPLSIPCTRSRGLPFLSETYILQPPEFYSTASLF